MSFIRIVDKFTLGKVHGMLNNVEDTKKTISMTKRKHAGKVIAKMVNQNVPLKIEYNAASQLTGMINGQKKDYIQVW